MEIYSGRIAGGSWGCKGRLVIWGKESCVDGSMILVGEVHAK